MGETLPGLEPQTEIAAERARTQRASHIVDIAEACVHIADHGAGQPFTFGELEEMISGPLTFIKKPDLPALVGVLAAKVAHAMRSQSADALLAMHQVGTIVDEWRKRHANAPAGSPQPAPAGGEEPDHA